MFSSRRLGVWHRAPRNIINGKTCCSHLQGRRCHKDGGWVYFETSAPTTSRDPNVNVTALNVSGWIQEGGGGSAGVSPPFESLAQACMFPTDCIFPTEFYFLLLNTCALPYQFSEFAIARSPRVSCTLSCIVPRVCDFTLRFYIYISSTYISLRVTRAPFLELKGGLFADWRTPHFACFWMEVLY